MKLNFKQLAIIYFIMLYLHITAVVYFPSVEPFTKPFLMLILLYWLYTHKSRITNKGVFNATALALVFSLIGDEFMVFEVGRPLVFLGGLSSFLIAHLFFIRAFSFQRNKKLKVSNSFLFSLMLQGVIIFMIFDKHIDNQLKIPMYLYCLVILSMVNFAYLRKNSIDRWNWNIGVIGAFSFVISDLLLAYNAFVTPFKFAPFVVLTHYGIAQFLIVNSIIYSFEAPED
jgi:uncharacterized membrane protein YhhN